MSIAMIIFLLSALLLLLPIKILSENPFESFQKTAMQSNPIREAEHRVGYGSNSIQPYYVCDKETSGSAMPLSAWHYSCKQACREDNKKTHIALTRVRWNFIGKAVSVYKVTANNVCYTSHENIWGYCTHAQTIDPVEVTEDDIKSLPKEYFQKDSKILGITNIINSNHADCSYLSDNTQCAKDYVITYREGKFSKKSDNDDLVLNIYGDGIRTNPEKGKLFNNDAAWFWNIDEISAEHECGWSQVGDTVCKITDTSEMMYCPDMGYQYNIHTLKATKTCVGEVYDRDGPMPFIYNSKQEIPDRDTVMNKAKEGKGDADVNMITGINSAFTEIEETYCSSSCDLFARKPGTDDNYVLDTPIGNWRLITKANQSSLLSPCRPTSTWRIRNPTTMCHGKNHILVEDSASKHSCSWDTTRDFIISEDVCNSDQKEIDQDERTLREQISLGEDISISFWTGDKMTMKPPYTKPMWEKSNTTVQVSPGWFSKVELNRGMLHNTVDLSKILTTMVENTKTEINYNTTEGKTMKKLLADEVLGGAEEMLSSIGGILFSLLGAIPKFAILVLFIILAVYIIQWIVTYYMKKKFSSNVKGRIVTFADDELEGFTTPVRAPSAPKKRTRSRSSKLSDDLAFI
uniref:Glycoprotein n=1 Tax=Beet betanucleorhabdovirus 1 TaxID=3064197 RepID=A0AAT9VV85_9RHAB